MTQSDWNEMEFHSLLLKTGHNKTHMLIRINLKQIDHCGGEIGLLTVMTAEANTFPPSQGWQCEGCSPASQQQPIVKVILPSNLSQPVLLKSSARQPARLATHKQLFLK